MICTRHIKLSLERLLPHITFYLPKILSISNYCASTWTSRSALSVPVTWASLGCASLSTDYITRHPHCKLSINNFPRELLKAVLAIFIAGIP
jgi:hypothetical protein